MELITLQRLGVSR